MIFPDRTFDWTPEVWENHIDSVCSLMGEYRGFRCVLKKEGLSDLWCVEHPDNTGRAVSIFNTYEEAKEFFLEEEVIPVLE